MSTRLVATLLLLGALGVVATALFLDGWPGMPSFSPQRRGARPSPSA